MNTDTGMIGFDNQSSERIEPASGQNCQEPGLSEKSESASTIFPRVA